MNNRQTMTAAQIQRQMERVLLRFQAGLITAKQAKQEQDLLMGLLRAGEVAELERKIERLEAALEARRR